MDKTREILVQVQDVGRRLAGINIELSPGQALTEIHACERELAHLAEQVMLYKLADVLGIELIDDDTDEDAE